MSSSELEKIAYNLPDGFILINKKNYLLRDLPYYWEKFLINYIEKQFGIDFFSFVASNIETNTISNLIKIICDSIFKNKMSEIAYFIANGYFETGSFDEFLANNEPGQIYNIVIAQLNRSCLSNKAAQDFLFHCQQKYAVSKKQKNPNDLIDEGNEVLNDYGLIERLCDKYSKIPNDIILSHSLPQLLLLIATIRFNSYCDDLLGNDTKKKKEGLESEIEQIQALEKMGFLAKGTANNFLANKGS